MIARAWLACIALGLALAGLPANAQRGPSPPALEEIGVSQLPREAQQAIALIRKGGPFPYAKDGAVFGNREGVLPRAKRGYYREYTVKTPGVRTRGARRIVAGAGGEMYYSDDHYNHFRRIRE
ncbi:MAG TPA: ribonuclease domain-containing protein, partial [Usitatibacter sp.]|nr:ribonuclease domain-containing protein [Usitatibacter sp.]